MANSIGGRIVFDSRSEVWLNDSRDSVYVRCRIIANWHDLYKKAEPPENNWALAPMDQWKRYGNILSDWQFQNSDLHIF